jgi:K(+)-stimulated pyrophosphate-energized sodium pump
MLAPIGQPGYARRRACGLTRAARVRRVTAALDEVMTELLLICAIGVLGVAFATTVARWLLLCPRGDADLIHVAELVTGGVVRYLRRQNVVAVASAAVMGAAVFLAYGLAYQVEVVTAVSPREHGVWLAVSHACGAGAGIAASWVASWAARNGAVRVAAGARRSLDDALQIAIRAGAIAGVVTVAFALIGLAGLFLAMVLFIGGFDEAAALATAPRVPLLLVGFALGASFVSLLAQLGGGIYAKVADLGADVAKLEASLPEDAVDNPAAVADLVGDTVGEGAARASEVFAASVAELSAAMLVAAMVYRHNADLPSVTAIVLFPLVSRTFSLLAAWFGVMVVRTDDTEVPMSALTRGLYVTTLLYAVGAVGSAKWLLGVHWVAFGSCAVLGAVGSLVIFHIVQYYSEQRYRPVRALAEAARNGPTLATLRGMFTATECTFALVAATTLVAMAAHFVGDKTALEGGGLLGIAIAVGGMLGSAPYVLAMHTMGSIADTAAGIIEMTVAAERPDVRARARLLDAVGTTVKGFSSSLATVTSTLACLLFAWMFLGEVWDAASADGGLDVHGPLLYLGGAFGLLVVLGFVWITLRRIVSSGRDMVTELRVQLSGGDRQAGGGLGLRLGIAEEGTDQLACVEIVSRIALRGMLAPAIAGVGIPLALGVILRIGASQDSVTSSAEALVALLVVATIAGALGSLLFTNAASAWDNAKKYIETGAHGGRYLRDTAAASSTAQDGTPRLRDNPAYVAAVIGDTIGDPLKGAVAPATQALLKTLTALALAFLPFFI